MKHLVYILFLVTSISFAQSRISKNVGDFNQIKVFSGLQVKLIKSNTNKVEIKGNKSEEVVVKNVNGLLKLSVKVPSVFEAEDVLIRVYYTSNLSMIDVNEGAIITSNDKIKQDFLELKVQEGAQIEMILATKKLKLKSVTGGIISLAGKSTDLSATANTGGNIEAFDLEVKTANVISSTGSEIEVNVIDVLDAKAKLKGEVIYKTKPKTLYKKKSLGGIVVSTKNRNSYQVYTN